MLPAYAIALIVLGAVFLVGLLGFAVILAIRARPKKRKKYHQLNSATPSRGAPSSHSAPKPEAGSKKTNGYSGSPRKAAPEDDAFQEDEFEDDEFEEDDTPQEDEFEDDEPGDDALEDDDHFQKIVLIGDPKSGKTCFVEYLIDNNDTAKDKKYVRTMGFNFIFDCNRGL